MTYQVAIPSYRRPVMLAERTLPTLLAGGVPCEQIRVYVHDHDPDLEEYCRLVGAHGVRLAVTNARGINAQRAAILHDYGPGTHLVQVDDDVKGMRSLHPDGKLLPLTDIDGLYRSMFRQTIERGLYVWGLAPVANPYFMRFHLSERLKFLIFSMWGCVTRPGHPVHESTVPTKDDYELSLRAWWYDGAVLRHDGIVADADIYKAPGGCQSTRTAAQAEDSVASLMRQWPGLVRRNTSRKSDYAEIILSSRKRHAGNAPETPPPGLSS